MEVRKPIMLSSGSMSSGPGKIQKIHHSLNPGIESVMRFSESAIDNLASRIAKDFGRSAVRAQTESPTASLISSKVDALGIQPLPFPLTVRHMCSYCNCWRAWYCVCAYDQPKALSTGNGGESSFAGWPDAKWPIISGLSGGVGAKTSAEVPHIGEDIPATPAQVFFS
jgi:hypothetical protein